MYHVLEYRIAPEQDLTYIKEVSLFGGLFKFNLKIKHSTKWKKQFMFTNKSSSYQYEIDDKFHYMPIFIDNQTDLNRYKNKYHTLAQWEQYVYETEQYEKGYYQAKCKQFLRKVGVWY